MEMTTLSRDLAVEPSSSHVRNLLKSLLENVDYCEDIEGNTDHLELGQCLDGKVCRTCFNTLLAGSEGESYFSVTSQENLNHIEELVKVCLPKVNLHLVMNPIVCKKCFESLNTFYKFVLACMNIEQELQEYCNLSGRLVPINAQDFLEYALKNKSSIVTIKQEKHNDESEQRIDPDICSNNNNYDIDVKKEEEQQEYQSKKVKRKILPRTRRAALKKVKKRLPDSQKSSSDDSNDNIKGEIKCEGCDKKFSSKGALERHLPVHLTSGTIYYCESCHIKFKYKHSYFKHLETHLSGIVKQKPFICECGKGFNRNAKLKKHQLIHIKMEKPFVCKYCGKRFTEENLLGGHIERVHLKEKAFRCQICGNRYTSKAGLDVHFKSHQPNGKPKPEADLMCDICGKLFSRKYGLEKHRMSHTGDKPHKCDQCEMRFKERYQLTIHVRSHTGEKPFECEICGFRFSCRNRLSVHMRKHTGERPFPCQFCEMAFTRNDHLIKHVRAIHTGERPFECDICKKSFNRKDYLLKHKKLHLKSS